MVVFEGLSGVKPQVIDRGALEGRAVSKDPKNRDRHGQHRSLEAGGADVPDGADAADFTPEELREFLAADYLDTYADPGFKDRLRKKLWTLVRYRYSPGSPSSNSS